MAASHRIRLPLGAVVLAVAAVTFTLGTPVPASAHDAYSNGCSYSPDSSYVPVYYNFHSACDRHDYCYHFHYYGDGYYGRLGCDNEFRANMGRVPWGGGSRSVTLGSSAEVRRRGVGGCWWWSPPVVGR